MSAESTKIMFHDGLFISSSLPSETSSLDNNDSDDYNYNKWEHYHTRFQSSKNNEQNRNNHNDNSNNDDNDNHDKDYERMDDHAFAGGSQGEVWRARRRCNQLISLNRNSDDDDDDDDDGMNMHTYIHPYNDDDNNYDSSDYNDDYYKHNSYESFPEQKSTSTKSTTANTTATCDASQMLIMKRLKVENGYALLEAGMREVYFGQLLLLYEQKFSSDSGKRWL